MGRGVLSCTLRACRTCTFFDGPRLLSSEGREGGPFQADPGSLASVKFLGEVLGLFIVGRICDTVCWLSLKDGLGTWPGTMLRNSATEGPACGDSESLTWSRHSEEPLPVPETVRELKVAPGDSLRHSGQPPPSGTRAPGVDPGLPYQTARLWAGGLTTHTVSVSPSVRVEEVICEVSSGTRLRARAWERLAVLWG